MDIYWIEQNQRKGPLPEVEIISLLERGELSEQTLAWHTCCSEWMPLEKLPALQSYFAYKKHVGAAATPPPAPGSASEQTPDPVPLAPASEAVMPPPLAMVNAQKQPLNLLRRAAARAIDLFLYFMLVLRATFLISKDPVELLFSNYYIFIIVAACILLEALMGSLFGTTVGKCLLGLQLQGENKSFLNNLKRSFLCYACGLGFMLNVLISFFCILVSVFFARQFGVFLWEARSNMHCRLHAFSLGKRMLSLAVLFLCMFANDGNMQSHYEQIQQRSQKLLEQLQR